MNDVDCLDPPEPAARRKHRRGRREETTRPQRTATPGGITLACGCRYVYTCGGWYHVTGGHGHILREWPVTDENMKKLLAA